MWLVIDEFVMVLIYLFFPWNNAKCLSNVAFFRRNINYTHSTWNQDRFFPSWTDWMCLFKSNFRAKLDSHDRHLWGLIPAWSVKTCFFKSDFREKLNSHRVHLWDFFSFGAIFSIFLGFDPWLTILLRFVSIISQGPFFNSSSSIGSSFISCCGFTTFSRSVFSPFFIWLSLIKVR